MCNTCKPCKPIYRGISAEEKKINLLMEYLDQVYVDLKDRKPGKFLMSNLKDPEKFIAAVKDLIDYGYLPNVHWDSSYSTLFIQEKFPFDSFKKSVKNPWYEHPKTTPEENN